MLAGKWQKRVFISMLITLVFLALDSYFQLFMGADIFGKPKLGDRLTGPLSKAVIGATIATLAMPTMAYFAHDLAYKKKHIVAGVLVIALIWSVVFFSGERAPFLRISISIGLIALLVLKTNVKKLALFLSAVVIIPVAAYFAFGNSPIIKRQIDSTIETMKHFEQSIYGKLWVNGLKVGSSKPIFGTGLKNYQAHCEKLHSGCEITQSNVCAECSTHPHNIYIEFFAETGLVGLALFLWLIFVMAKTFYPLPGFEQSPQLIGILIGIVFTAFPLLSSMGFFQNAYGVPLWFMIGWALSMQCVLAEKKISS